MLRALAIFSLTSLIFTIFTNLDLQAQEYTDIKVRNHSNKDCYFIQVHPHEQQSKAIKTIYDRELPVVRTHYTYSYKNSPSW
ncbi:hypothetical protein [Candidatus Uabimicrobium sp. HlEnr_7]|uniref:hypothetical protein n=1 Tax=Candidatus Uabimicrobium helgolandensis TaxID=3095367 RepID=UPI00355846E4